MVHLVNRNVYSNAHKVELKWESFYFFSHSFVETMGLHLSLLSGPLTTAFFNS